MTSKRNKPTASGPNQSSRPVRTAEDLARYKAIRERFQREKPSLEELVSSGEYNEPLPMGEYLSIRQAVFALKKNREAAGLSLADVAERTGIDKAALSRIETGQHPNPTVSTLCRYAHALGKRWKWVLEDEATQGREATTGVQGGQTGRAMTRLRVLVYKRTHTGDPDEYGCFGANDCMGTIRDRDFGAVIGVGGVGDEPEASGIAGKLNWIGIGPHKLPPQGRRGPVVTFDHFRDFGLIGPDFRSLAPMLAERMSANNVRHVMDDITDAEYGEIEGILRLAEAAPPSRGWPDNRNPPVAMRRGVSVDMHHNLFYSYRGPNIDDADRDRQLENNLTKALINTLSLGGESVCHSFLAELGLAYAHHPDFLLQRRDLPSGGAVNRRQRMLLGISKKKATWTSSEDGEAPDESVPDAWVYGDGFAVLVESKLDGDFLPGQMQGHLARLRSSDGAPPSIIVKTWGEIHGFFQTLLPSLTDAVPRLLVTQLVQFLEFSGMTGFTGFRPEHFDYFTLHDNDDARCWVREQMDDFAAQVVAGLRKVAPFYEDYDVGVLRLDDAYCWVAFGPPDKKYRSVTHQSLSLTAAGLEVFVNAEVKQATDRIKDLLSRSAAQFRKALEDQHRLEPFELIVQKRTQRQGSLFDYTPQLRLHSSMLVDNTTSDIAWKAFEDTVKVLPLPYLRIERVIPRTTLLELSSHAPPRVVQHVVELLLRNDPLVKLLNT